jgi:hypothetical protein
MPFPQSSQLLGQACEALPSIWRRCIFIAQLPGTFAQSLSRQQQLIALLTLCTVILLARKPDAFMRPQFLAEDGTLYFAQAHHLGMAAIWQPYRGTYWLFQRLVAQLGTYLPAAYEPRWYNFASLMATLTVISFVFLASADLRFRPILALALLWPNCGEVYVCLVNSHWILGLILPLVVISHEPATFTRRALEVLLLSLAALSGPLILTVLPLFLLRALLRWTRYSLLLLAVAAACGLAQFVQLEVSRSEGTVCWLNAHWLGFWGNGLSGLLFCNRKYLFRCPNNPLLFVVTVMLFAGLTLDSLLKKDLVRLVFLTTALAVLLTTSYAYRFGQGPERLSQCLGSRYQYIPTVMLIWSIALTRPKRLHRVCVQDFLLLWIGLASFSHFRFEPLEDYRWPEACRIVTEGRPGRIPINPAGWFIDYSPQ